MGLIGLISDTHGLVRPAVFDALKGVELILHAGDVGDGVLAELSTIAPILAVRGNTDPAESPDMPLFQEVTRDGVRIRVTHGHELGIPTPEELLAKYDADVVVYGHTHRKSVEQRGLRWAVNPGAAGQRRFDARPSVARMSIGKDRTIKIDFVEL
jgi:putative phosphoesterase